MFKKIENKIRNKNLKIVFPEGEDIRIIKAAKLLVRSKLAKVILLGDIKKINNLLNYTSTDIQIIDPMLDIQIKTKIDFLFELRQGKNTLEECKQMLTLNNYYATLLVKMKLVDVSLGGAVYSTKDIITPAFQIIKSKVENKKVTSCFLLTKKKQPSLIMGDCAISENPSSEELASSAVEMAICARMFDLVPKVAMLSYSTAGSGKGLSVDKVVAAVEILAKKQVDFVFGGEIQFDAATNRHTSARKVPNSPLKGESNVLVYPNLDAANIGYKIASSLGGYQALGPILLGLAAPVNDLSRSCCTEEVYKMALITLMQALK